MRFELFVARKYLFSPRRHAFISVIASFSILGVSMGVGILIIVMGVMNGFTEDLRNKILGVTSHAIVFDGSAHCRPTEALMETILAVPGVIGATPFIYSELMASTSAGSKGVVLRAIDPASARSVLGALSNIDQERLDSLAISDPLPGILVGTELARRLGLEEGSRINLMAPTGQQGSAGFTPKIKSFRVAGIFSIGMFEYDSSLVFVALPVARELLGWPEDIVTGIELAFSDIFKAIPISRAVEDAIGSPYYIQTWIDMNGNLFAALELEKTAMGIVLTLVIVVAAFSIVTALVMLVMEKTRDIAVLMSMGATRQRIRRLFTLQGLVIGGVGTVLGFVFGLSACALLQEYQFVKLPRGVYSMDHLPVLLLWQDLAAIGVTAMIICFLATIYPSYKASSLEPVAALRHE